MTLYELNETIRQVIEDGFTFDEETGEVLFTEDDLNNLQMEFDTKVENIALYIKELKALIEVIKNEKMALAKRQAQKERKVEYLTDYLTAMLNGNKFESSKVAISYRKSQKVECSDITKVDNEFLRFKEPELDKARVKELLKKGIEVNGCYLAENTSTIIR